MTSFPARGDSIAVNISPEGKQRLQVGIGWDIREKWVEKGFLIKKHEKVHETYDMDIFCLIYNDEKEYVEIVSPHGDQMADSSESIYHSGDNDTGRGDHDDEFISIDLKNVPDYIHHIVFVVMTQGEFTFGQVLNAEARIAEGKTNENLLYVDLSASEGASRTACVFIRLYRDSHTPLGWKLQNISEYCDYDSIEDWTEEAKKYL